MPALPLHSLRPRGDKLEGLVGQKLDAEALADLIGTPLDQCHVALSSLALKIGGSGIRNPRNIFWPSEIASRIKSTIANTAQLPYYTLNDMVRSWLPLYSINGQGGGACGVAVGWGGEDYRGRGGEGQSGDSHRIIVVRVDKFSDLIFAGLPGAKVVKYVTEVRDHQPAYSGW